jgi:DNA-binding XRE family transcriptional regulator
LPPRRRELAEAAPEPLWREVVGRELRAARTERGERIADVARRAGVSPQYLSEVERGRKDPSSEILSASPARSAFHSASSPAGPASTCRRVPRGPCSSRREGVRHPSRLVSAVSTTP